MKANINGLNPGGNMENIIDEQLNRITAELNMERTNIKANCEDCARVIPIEYTLCRDCSTHNY